MDIVVDTNIIIWYFDEYSRLTKLAETTVDDAAENGTLFVSSITIVELTYLIEKDRVPKEVLAKLREALDDDATAFELAGLSRRVADELQNIDRSIVADMHDRIVAATALHLGLPLVTSDGNLQRLSNVETIW
ncbi:MAG: PIN domain-containing protein [Chloracidobacterium sp.]|mgnify:CR=1 FL=1|nr:PIN domain-containing protein [Chloracidobacterium sp.]MCO5333261.1 PIN domain-containing protein [Pyrinomonadaceae bacterium]